jgi:catechol 2,3-dioxygenase-like lactoylglutathione lyase family enzyme
MMPWQPFLEVNQMHLGHIELFVTDPVQARQFYEEVLGFVVTAVQGNGQFIWLKLDDTEILLRPGQESPFISAYDQATAGLVLYTTDLEQTSRKLSQRGLRFKGSDGDDDCFTFTDPDGHWFQLVNPESHSR